MAVEDTEPETQEEPSLRETLESAFEADSTGEGSTEVEAKPSSEAPAEASEGEKPTEAREDGRDAQGRFKPKEAPAEKTNLKAGPSPQTGQEVKALQPATQVTPEAPATPALKAPNSWKPAAREKWANVPPEVQAEVQRREFEVRRALDESASSRQLADNFRQAVAPYEAMVRAEGAEPVQAVASLLRTAAALRTAPVQHKAALIANMVQTYGIPIQALDAALAGQPIPQTQQQQFRDSRFDEFLGHLQQQQAQRQQALNGEVEAARAAFAESHEFYEDVKEDMADLMEVAAKRGQAMDYEDAYARALHFNPDTAAILQQREAAKSAQTNQVANARARNAASSIKNQPSGPRANGGEELSLRDELSANWDAHS